jgi:hypothetical protein
MKNDKYNPVAALGNYVLSVIKSINSIEKEMYPVLGAEGSNFFIEVAVGIFESRRILKTIHVEISRELDNIGFEDALIADADTSIELPDESFLIALLGLFQSAMDAKAMVLHPLDNNGNFLPGWNQAVIMVSSNTIS